jgi:hypothetical protein
MMYKKRARQNGPNKSKKMSKSKNSASNTNYNTHFQGENMEADEQNNQFNFNGLESYIRNLKKATAKNVYPENKTRMIDTKQLNSSKLLKKADRPMSSKRGSVRRSQNRPKPKENVYDSFSMPNSFLDMSSTPGSNNRYKQTANKNSKLNLSHSYMNNMLSNESILRLQKNRLSESTKPVRRNGPVGQTPSKSKQSRGRASSNPRTGVRESFNQSATSLKSRKGKMMSATKLNKIVNGKNSKHQLIIDQRDRIRKIYNPTNLALKSSSSNIMVSDEFPSIKSKNSKTGMSTSFNAGSRLNKSRHSTQIKESNTNDFINSTGEWKANQYIDNVGNPLLAEGGMVRDANQGDIMGHDDMAKLPRNDIASHSLIGNLSGKGKLVTGASSQDISTVSINAKKNGFPNGYEQSLSNMIKYDTTAVISEEFSNNEDHMTHLMMQSILQGNIKHSNIEEVHILHVTLQHMLKKILKGVDNTKTSDENKSQEQPKTDNNNIKNEDESQLINI